MLQPPGGGGPTRLAAFTVLMVSFPLSVPLSVSRQQPFLLSTTSLSTVPASAHSFVL